MELLNKEYIHVGTDKIYKELWQNIRMDYLYRFYTKPYGGLWCSNKNTEICDWINYIKYEEKDKLENLYYQPSCIIKFKNDSKILIINNKNDLLNLRQSNLIKDLSNNPITINKFYYTYNIDFLLDYEKISEYYDLLYVNPYIDECFKNFSINTMLALNPDSIEYYIPVELDINNDKILSIGNKCYITEPNKDYFDYIEYIKKCFKDINEIDYDTFLIRLTKLKYDIIHNKNNLYNNLGFSMNNIDSLKLLESVSNNIYRDIAKEKRKVLHK